MVTTASAEDADWMRVAALHGLSRDAWARYAPGAPAQYDVVMAGYKYNMMDLQAALGLAQLARLGEMQAHRAASLGSLRDGTGAPAARSSRTSARRLDARPAPLHRDRRRRTGAAGRAMPCRLALGRRGHRHQRALPRPAPALVLRRALRACDAACFRTPSITATTRCRCRSGAGCRLADADRVVETIDRLLGRAAREPAARGDVASRPATFALFRVAAGPRIGLGHLRRAEVLARALGRAARVSIRGGSGISTTLAARRARPEPGRRSMPSGSARARARRPACRPWSRVGGGGDAPAACRSSACTTSGLPASLDARHRRQRHQPGARLAGGAHPARPRLRGHRPAPARARVWRRPPRARLARRRAARGPDARGRRVSSCRRHPHARGARDADGRGRPSAAGRRSDASTAPDGLAPWLARVDVAIVGGGVSLYEAVAAGVPTVAVPSSPAQRPTIRGFAARRLAVDAGGPVAPSTRLVARRVVRALRAARAGRASCDARCTSRGRVPSTAAAPNAWRSAIVAVAEAARRG